MDAKRPPDHESAIRDVMGGAEREFLDPGVDEKGANFQKQWVGARL
jgi:hypothetical protein